jgi:hypothetical protein
VSNLDYYLLKDHAARRQTTAICVEVGIFVGLVLLGLGWARQNIALAIVIAALAVELIRAFSYKQPNSVTYGPHGIPVFGDQDGKETF